MNLRSFADNGRMDARGGFCPVNTYQSMQVAPEPDDAAIIPQRGRCAYEILRILSLLPKNHKVRLVGW